MASVTHGMIDNSGEGASVTFYLPDVTPANYADITGNGPTDNVGALRLAVAGISLANSTRHTVTTEVYPEAGTLPSSPWAQREIKLLVQFVDTVNSKKGTVSIPAPDLSILAQPGTDVVDHVSNVAAAAFVAAFEANAVSQDGNPITVTGMRIIGRNS